MRAFGEAEAAFIQSPNAKSDEAFVLPINGNALATAALR
jgi:hypothetical protein